MWLNVVIFNKDYVKFKLLNYQIITKLKKILFVLPFSSTNGLGHLYRCSVISKKFKNKKFKTILFKQNHSKTIIQNKKLIKDFNFDIILNKHKYKSLILTIKKLNPDYLVIDSPNITKKLKLN